MKRIEVGDVVRDNHGRDGVVVREEPAPEQAWIDAQTDARVASIDRACRWLAIMPFEGGLVVSPEPLTHRLRRANVDDVGRVVATSNVHGVKLLVAIFPDEVGELLRRSSG